MVKKKDEYIRGLRQLEAIWILITNGLYNGIVYDDWACAKRELEIMSGFAKPYNVIFSKRFAQQWEDLGFSRADLEEMGEIRAIGEVDE